MLLLAVCEMLLQGVLHKLKVALDEVLLALCEMLLRGVLHILDMCLFK